MTRIVLALLVICSCGDNLPGPTDPDVSIGPADPAGPRYFGLHLCARLGCDGTQSIPLWCPDPNDMAIPCFCAAPHLSDEWCLREVP